MSDNPEPNMTPRYWTITKVVRDTEPQSVNKMLSEGWVLLRVYTAYEVTGDSMAPEIPSGARVIVRVQDYASPGNEIVCWVPEYGMLVKRLESSPTTASTSSPATTLRTGPYGPRTFTSTVSSSSPHAPQGRQRHASQRPRAELSCQPIGGCHALSFDVSRRHRHNGRDRRGPRPRVPQSRVWRLRRCGGSEGVCRRGIYGLR